MFSDVNFDDESIRPAFGHFPSVYNGSNTILLCKEERVSGVCTVAGGCG
jgi:hypothetical protein